MVVALTPFRNAARRHTPTCCCRSRRSPRPPAPSSTPKAACRASTASSAAGRRRPAGRCCACWATCSGCRASITRRPKQVRDEALGNVPDRRSRLSNTADRRRRHCRAAGCAGLERMADVPIYPPMRWCAARRRCRSPPTRGRRWPDLPQRCWAQLGLSAGATGAGHAGRRGRRVAGPRWNRPGGRRRARRGRRMPRPRRWARCSARSASKRCDEVRPMLATLNDTASLARPERLGRSRWPVAWSLIKIVALVLPLMGCVAYLTLWERKVHRLHADPPRPQPRRPVRACCSRSPTRSS